MDLEIREFNSNDYEAALALWKRCEGIGLSAADERCPLLRFLERNAGLSFVAFDGDELVGTVLCGHDGRRGYIYHLAVDPRYRHRGLGKQLTDRSLAELKAAGIDKSHIMVFGTNKSGLKFWQDAGWKTRPEIVLLSYDIKGKDDKSPC
jgi:ribosomal protein S18 acetylase RimI-like enzyme